MSDEALRNLRRHASQGDELALARLGIEQAVVPGSGTFVDVHEGLRIQLPDGVPPEAASIAGATQYETHSLCRRKWWFLWGVKLPKTQADFFTFGTVLHAAAERYELADDLGRDKDGKTLNLWPEGWDKDVTPADALLIRKLVTAGIEAGLIGRRRGRQVEHAFLTPLGEYRGRYMFISGKIDLLFVEDAEIEDHKSTKNMKYAKGPKLLAKNIQMRTYGKQLQSLRLERGLPIADVVKVRHNVFCKDPDKPAVKITEAFVTAQDIEDRHKLNVAASHDMVDLKVTYTDPEEWHRIPDPVNTVKACMAYGGCNFATICGGRETARDYTTRIENMLAAQNPQETIKMTATASPFANTKKAPAINGDVPQSGPADDAMFAVVIPATGKSAWRTGAQIRAEIASGTILLESKAQLKGAGQWSTVTGCGFTAPVAEEPLPPEEEPQPPEEPGAPAPSTPAPSFTVAGVPPWAVSDCTSCSTGPHPGFNPNGNPCRICDDVRLKAKQTSSNDFVVATDGEKHVTWTAKGAMAPAGQTAVPKADTPVTQKKTSRGATPAPAPPPADAGEPQVNQKPGKGAGRPKVTFRLYINCMPVGRDVLDITEILKTYGDQLAKNSEKTHYSELDPFARRDSLAAYAEKIAGDIEGKHLVATGIGSGASDLRALVDALRPYASDIVSAVA